MSMYDLAHEIRVQRESQERALLRKTAILLLDFKTWEQPTQAEFIEFCENYLNISKSTGYRLIKELKAGNL